MKIGGRTIKGPQIKTLVFPREDGDLIFKMRAVLSFDEFEKQCPAPQPPEILYRGGDKGVDLNDAKYLEKLSEWAEFRTHWMILKSLEATPGLEWDNVDMSNPRTWNTYREDLKVAGISDFEAAKIVGKIQEACGMNETLIEEATKNFLATQQKDQ